MRIRSALLCLVLAAAAGAAQAKVEVDFDPKANFEGYKTWDWVPGRDQVSSGVLVDATMRERVEKQLALRLNGTGMRQAAAGEKADVLVSYRGDIGTGKTIETSAGALANWADPGYATLQFAEQKATLLVDLIDAGTNKLSWRLYVDEKWGGPNDSAEKLRKSLDKGFAKYPPSVSEREKRAKKLAH